ncbi:MAG: hypothetical protein P8009_03430, partial [Gammaproteobacteria bacterium]
MDTPNPTNGAAPPVSLESEVATVAEELYELFAQPDTEAEDRQSEALARYVRSIGRIGIVASANGRRPVKDACIAFQDRLKVLAASGQRLSPGQRELLEAWPVQLMACLSVPVDPVAVDALIALLRSEEWREPMTEAEAAALRGAFLPAAAAGIVQDPPRERSPAETADAAVEAAVPAAADESAQPIGAPIVVGSGVIADLRRELADTMDGLNATLAAGGESVEETAATLELAGERMALLGMSAAAAGLVGMMDACTLFQGALSELAASGLPVDVEARKAIGRWTARLDAYLLAPTEPTAIDALLDYLAALPWGGGLSESERANLRELLLQGATAESDASEDWGEELTDRPVGAGDDSIVSLRDSSAGTAEAVSGDDAAAAGETTGDEGGGPTAETNQSVELDWFAAAAPARGEDESGDAGEGSLDEVVEAPHGAVGNEVSGLLPSDDRSRGSDWLADPAPPMGEGASDDAGDASFGEQVEMPGEAGRSEAAGPLPESNRSDELDWFADSTPPGGEQQHANAGETSFEEHTEASSEVPGSEVSGPLREADQPSELDWLADAASADSPVQRDDTGQAGGVSGNEIGDQARELIELLSVELETSVERLGEQLNQMLDADADDETRRDAIDEYLAQIEPFTLASESLGLMGLSEALSCLQENLQVLRDA